ncbi:hypothetical protein JXA12_03880 [Candidatus Woesearchaeota archaeon]|nr:hypothetical protein [Candidatus Woesearchaeota archaeon]
MADRVTKLSRKDVKEKVRDGWLRAVVLFEMVGSPKEHIEKTLQAFLDNINTDSNIITLSEDFEEAIEIDESNGLFSVAAEVEYLVFGLEKLTWFAFNFMPASIEIKDPSELTFRERDFTNWMNDLLAKLHEVNTQFTALKTEKDGLLRNFNASIRNNVLLAVEGSMTPAEIAGRIGVQGKDLEPFLEAMVKEKRLVKDGKKYKKK